VFIQCLHKDTNAVSWLKLSEEIPKRIYIASVLNEFLVIEMLGCDIAAIIFYRTKVTRSCFTKNDCFRFLFASFRDGSEWLRSQWLLALSWRTIN